MLPRKIRATPGRTYLFAAIMLAGMILLSACSTRNSADVNSSAYLGEYSYDSSISAMVYEDMDGEGEGIQYRRVTDYDKLIAYSSVPVCLYFYAGLDSDTSGITASVEQLAETYHGRITFVSIDAQAETDLAAHFEIEALPDFVLLDKGSWIASFSSYSGKTWTASDLEEWITANSGIS